MRADSSAGPILVLSSRARFEALAGPVPARLEDRFRFVKPGLGRTATRGLHGARLVVSKSYSRSAVNRWILAARRSGVPTLLLVDGPLEWANVFSNPSLPAWVVREGGGLYQPIVHDGVATIGEAQARVVEGWNRGRGVRFVSYANRRIRSASSGPVRTEEFDLLLTSARTAAFDREERLALGGALERVARVISEGGHRVLVRLFDPVLRRRVKRILPNARYEEQGSSGDAIARTRAVIGTPSSVLLEAMVRDRPTATLDFRGTPRFYETGWRIDPTSNVAETLRSLLAGGAVGMAQQHSSIRENVSDQDFYAICDGVLAGELLREPRRFDREDEAFEAALARSELRLGTWWRAGRRRLGDDAGASW